MVPHRSGLAPLGRADPRRPRRSLTIGVKASRAALHDRAAQHTSNSRQEPSALPVDAEAPCRTAGPRQGGQRTTTMYRPDSADPIGREGAGRESSRRTVRPTKPRAEPCCRCGPWTPPRPSSNLRTSRCANARASPLYSELGRSCGIRHPRDRGLRDFKETASATLLEAAFAGERDDASRLAQRCTQRPHSFALLDNSLLRMRPSLCGSITSLRFCCAGWAPTRGRELSGERPRTLI